MNPDTLLKQNQEVPVPVPGGATALQVAKARVFWFSLPLLNPIWY
jgi:hypothetical protein